MVCPITLSSRKAPCPSQGGVPSMLLIDKSARITAGVTAVVASGVVTFADTGGLAFEVIPNQNKTTFSQPITASTDDNTFSFVQTLETFFSGIDPSGSVLIESITKGVMEIAIQQMDGTWLYSGLEVRGMRVTGGDGGNSGAGINDQSGFSLTITGESTTLAPKFDYANFLTSFTVTAA